MAGRKDKKLGGYFFAGFGLRAAGFQRAGGIGHGLAGFLFGRQLLDVGAEHAHGDAVANDGQQQHPHGADVEICFLHLVGHFGKVHTGEGHQEVDNPHEEQDPDDGDDSPPLLAQERPQGEPAQGPYAVQPCDEDGHIAGVPENPVPYREKEHHLL